MRMLNSCELVESRYTGIVAKNQSAGIGTLRPHFPRRAMTSPAAPVALFGSTGGVGPSGRPAPKTGGSGAHGLSAETALAVRPRPWLLRSNLTPPDPPTPARDLTRPDTHPPTIHLAGYGGRRGRARG